MAKLLLPSVVSSELSPYEPYEIRKTHHFKTYDTYQKARSAMIAAPPIVAPTIPPTPKSAHAMRRIQMEQDGTVCKTYQ
jgi:hypothetical protein